MISGSVSLLCSKVLSTFPSRYWFNYRSSVVFSLRDGPRIRAGFLASALLRCRLACLGFRYGAFTRGGFHFSNGSPNFRCRFVDGPTTRPCRDRAVWARARCSPLLTQSTFVFFFLRLLRCFSSPLALVALQDSRSPATGCPHRTIRGFNGYLPLTAAFAACTSFSPSESLGILHVPFSPFLVLYKGKSPFSTCGSVLSAKSLSYVGQHASALLR